MNLQVVPAKAATWASQAPQQRPSLETQRIGDDAVRVAKSPQLGEFEVSGFFFTGPFST